MSQLEVVTAPAVVDGLLRISGVAVLEVNAQRVPARMHLGVDHDLLVQLSTVLLPVVALMYPRVGSDIYVYRYKVSLKFHVVQKDEVKLSLAAVNLQTEDCDESHIPSIRILREAAEASSLVLGDVRRTKNLYR